MPHGLDSTDTDRGEPRRRPHPEPQATRDAVTSAAVRPMAMLETIGPSRRRRPPSRGASDPRRSHQHRRAPCGDAGDDRTEPKATAPPRCASDPRCSHHRRRAPGGDAGDDRAEPKATAPPRCASDPRCSHHRRRAPCGDAGDDRAEPKATAPPRCASERLRQDARWDSSATASRRRSRAPEASRATTRAMRAWCARWDSNPRPTA